MPLKIEVPKEMIDKLHEAYKKEIWVDHEAGVLKYKEIPIFWSRSELLYNMFKEMVGLMGQSAGAIMERATRPHGGGFVAFLREEKKEASQSREGIMRLACADALATGWGQVRMEESHQDIRVICEKGFPVGQMYVEKGERSPGPVDYYFLGYFTGVLSAMDNKVYKGVEEECIAKGDERCVFVFKK